MPSPTCAPSPANPLPPRPRGWAPWAVGLTAAALAAVSFRHGQDFAVFWRAGRRFWSGAPLYPASDGMLQYRYAPGVALLFSPFAPLPLPLAKALWYALTVALLVHLARLLPRRFPGPGAAAAVPLAFLALARPFLEELAAAQANVLVLALLLLAFQAEDDGRELGAGLLVSVAVGLKLAPLLVAADWLLRRRWRALAGLAAGLALTALAPLPFYGLGGTAAAHLSWLASLRAASADMIAHPGNQSVFAVAARLGLPPTAGAAAAALLVLVALRAAAPEPRRSLLLFGLALASSYGWSQNFVLALPAVFLLASAGPGLAWAAVALGLPLVLLIYDVVGRSAERWAFDHSVMTWPMLALFTLTALFARGPGEHTSRIVPRAD